MRTPLIKPFKEAARDAIAHAMQALAAADCPVTLANVHDVLSISRDLDSLLARLATFSSAAAQQELQYFHDFAKQPAEQRGGTVSSVANFLRLYAVPDIAEVFSAIEPNFSLTEVDTGRLPLCDCDEEERRRLEVCAPQISM